MCVWSKNNPDAENIGLGREKKTSKKTTKNLQRSEIKKVTIFLVLSLHSALTGAFLSLSVILTLTYRYDTRLNSLVVTFVCLLYESSNLILVTGAGM